MSSTTTIPSTVLVATMRESVFLDTSYALALLNSSDRHHASAVQWATTIANRGVQLITSEIIFLEIGNSFSRVREWPRARRLIEAPRASKDVDVFVLSEGLFASGWELRCRREDKDWGLVDCTSFEIMHQCGIRAALTADKHFIQAGFRALLLE